MPTPSEITRELDHIQHSYSQLAALCADQKLLDTRAEAVSGWSIAEHIEHLILAGRPTVEAIQALLAGKGDPPKVKLVGKVALIFRWIPRKGAQAPDFVRPSGMLIPALGAAISELSDAFASFDAEAISQSTLGFKHPELGTLSAAQWLAFTEIHNWHHLKIIRDILKHQTLASPTTISRAS